MRLPNGYGSITKMSGKRRRPYIIRKTTGWHYDEAKGTQVQDCMVIGYAATKTEALKILAEYNENPYSISERNMTFSQVWEAFASFKFGENRKTAVYYAYACAYKHCDILYDRAFISLRRTDLQTVIDHCDR